MCVYFMVIMPFRREKKYILMEMERAEDAQEYAYWKNELKKLYVKLIPIVGWLKK